MRKNAGEQILALSRELDALRSDLKNHASQMRFINDFSQQFNSNISFSEAINVGLEALWHAEEVDSVAALLGEDELGPFHYVGIRGVDDPFAFLGKESPMPLWGILAHALVHQPAPGELDCLTVANILAEGKPQPEEFPWLPAQGSLMIVPLRGRGKTIGAIILCNNKTDTFEKENSKRFLSILVGFLSRSLVECRLHEESMRRARHMVSLQLLTWKMAGIPSVESLLDVLSEESTDMFGTVNVHLFLESANEAESGYATFCLYSGQRVNEQEERFLHSPNIQQLLSWVVEAEQPIFVDPSEPIQSLDAVYYRESGRGVLIPILGSQQTAGGVLLLLAPAGAARPFDEDDLIVMRTIANSASVAISHLQTSKQAALILA